MKRYLLTAMLIVLPIAAQQKEVKEERTTKLVRLKYVDPEAIRGMISQFGVTAMPNSQMKAMTLSGLPAQIAAAEAALQQLDVAPKNIELVAYFVVGSDKPNLAGSPVPQEIRDVIGQLKTTFTFKDYRMLDVLTLRTRAGSSAESSGILETGSSTPRLSMFSVRNATVSEDGTTVRLDRMHAGVRIPIFSQGAKTEYLNTGIDQDIDVKEGQKVVVGRASLEGPEKALFLILMAKVM